MEISEIKSVIEEIHSQDITKDNVDKLKSVFEHVTLNYSDFKENEVILAQLLQTYLKLYVCPVVIVYWDEEKQAASVSAGSGVLLNLEEKFLVTNRHVIEFYRSKKREKSPGIDNPIIQIGSAKINLDTALIDENETLDLATIRITDENLSVISQTSYKEFFCPVQWNEERKLNSKDTITIAGFPGVYRHDLSSKESQFNSATATMPVMDTNDKTIYIEIEVGQALKIFGDEDPQDLNISFGGLSGGGVFFFNEEGLDLFGIIKEDGAGLFSGIQATYSSLIKKDGTINTKYDLY
jgi:hypothetical protein